VRLHEVLSPDDFTNHFEAGATRRDDKMMAGVIDRLAAVESSPTTTH
jgi:hypothetical protein